MTLDWPKLWRLFIHSFPLQALVMGMLAAALAAALWSLAPATFTAFDWTAYDTWLRHRAPIVVSPSLTVVVRDSISQERLGATLDRSLLAHMITAAHEAGAAAIGLDHRLDHGNSAQTGGAASDALLMEAVQMAAPVVFVDDPASTLRSDAILFGHVLVSTDADHVSRRIPLLV